MYGSTDPGQEETMPEVEEQAGPSPAEKKAIAKRIAAVRHRIKNPKKEGREAWSPEELEKLEARLAELEAERGPVAERKSKFLQGISREETPKRGPGELIPEQRAVMARFTSGLQGEAPTIERLVKHAEKFGTDQVLETAADLGYGHDACVRLVDALDRIEAAAYRKDHPKAPPLKFGNAEKRVAAVLGPRREAA
jgi:hypothetical protein